MSTANRVVMETDQVPNLRERRRLATAAEISEAALRLFETQGADNTTVADIALTAGVSQRTFFRYFDSKEMAALKDLGYADAIERWSHQDGDDGDAFISMLEMLQEALRTMVESTSRDHLLRMRRLIRTETSVRNASMRSDANHTESLQKALQRRSRRAYSDLEITMLSRLASSIIDTAVSYWESLIEAGQDADLPKIFNDACNVVRSALPPK